MTVPGFHRRLEDLEDNISKVQVLLKKIEDRLMVTSDPMDRERLTQDTKYLKQKVDDYREEYSELGRNLTTGQSTEAMQNAAIQLESMDTKLNLVLNSQNILSENIEQIRQDFLSRYEIVEQRIIWSISQQLTQNQLALARTLLDALDANYLSKDNVHQIWAMLEDRILALPPTQTSIAEFVKDPGLDARHKLEVSIPIIPFILDYKGELELGTGVNIKTAWGFVKSKLRG